MEEERELMVAEVEAQIERALASMLVDDEEGAMYRSQSRPTSRGSRMATPIAVRSRSAPGSRRASFTAADMAPPMMDSFAPGGIAEHTHVLRESRSMVEEAIEEERDEREKEEREKAAKDRKDQQKELSKKKSRNFEDMDPLDAGISEKSDRIAQKVLQIQQKVR